MRFLALQLQERGKLDGGEKGDFGYYTISCLQQAFGGFTKRKHSIFENLNNFVAGISPMPVYHTHTDVELLSLIGNNDEQAFTEIYRRYWSLAYRDAMKVLRSPADAEDVVQELFESIWKRRHTIQVQTALPAYLRTSARYLALHKIEQQPGRYMTIGSLADYLLHAEQAGIEAQWDTEQLKTTIDAIVGGLPDKMQQVFRLSREQQLSHREIAEQLDISEATVKKQVQNALKIIRQGIDKLSIGCLLFPFF